jgi:hypothetical protein
MILCSKYNIPSDRPLWSANLDDLTFFFLAKVLYSMRHAALPHLAFWKIGPVYV